jgi:dolichol-phosphate mannosyltransferase
MGLFAILTRMLAIPIELASPIAIEVSILSNFLLNNMWTFKWRQRDNSLFRRLCQFHIVSASAAIINYSTLLLLVKMFRFWDIGSNLVGISIGTLFNFGLNSLWTWKNAEKEQM